MSKEYRNDAFMKKQILKMAKFETHFTRDESFLNANRSFTLCKFNKTRNFEKSASEYTEWQNTC